MDDGLTCKENDKVKILEEYDDWYWVRLNDQASVLGDDVTDRMGLSQLTTLKS